MRLLGVWILGACWSDPDPPRNISDCPDLDCQQAWVLEHYAADPRGVSEWIAAVEDPIEQHALVSVVGERWPEDLKTLCQALQPGDALRRCQTIESRPHLWEPASEQVPVRPSMIPVGIVGPFAAVPSLLEDPCQDSIARHSCLQDHALRLVQEDSAQQSAALCQQIEDGIWREECFFRVAERAILSGDQAFASTMGLCLEAGRFESNCRDHVRNTLTWHVPSVDAGNLYSWQERARGVEAMTQQVSQESPEFGRYIEEVYWAEVMEKAYASTEVVIGFPAGVLPAAAGSHARASAAARMMTMDAGLSRTLAEWVEALTVALAASRDFDDITMQDGRRTPPRVVDLWAGQGADAEATVVYRSGSRRLIASDVRVDLAICVLEAAARTKPVQAALLEEGLEHDDPLVQQTARRLLQ